MSKMTAVLLVACALVGGGIGGATLANSSTTARSCPDGKTLVAVQVTTGKGTLSVEQTDAARLPPGSSFEAGGGGAVVTSDARSATVRGGGPLDVALTCRSR